MASGRLRFLGLFFALNALLLPFAQAQTQDLLQVWTKAQQRDPILAAAQANRAAQSERVPQARALLLPYITAGTGVEADDIRSTSLDHSNTDKRATWALTLTQPIIDLGLWDTYRASEYIEQSATL
ncbi:MAG TPA: hypothetical protein DEB15_08835, partial [Pusillimonas sp.]|nr:hypothetical protein [Pusillimonas sp.]